MTNPIKKLGSFVIGGIVSSFIILIGFLISYSIPETREYLIETINNIQTGWCIVGVVTFAIILVGIIKYFSRNAGGI